MPDWGRATEVHGSHRGPWRRAVVALGLFAILALAGALVPQLQFIMGGGDDSSEFAALQMLRSLRAAERHYRERHGRYASIDALHSAGLYGMRDGEATLPERPDGGYRLFSRAGTDHDTITALPPCPGMNTYSLVDGTVLP